MAAKTKKKRPVKVKRRPISEGLRYDVFARANFRCEACGASPKDKDKDKDEEVRLEVDHIIPVSKGGSSAFNNLQALCRACNLGKAAKYKKIRKTIKKKT
jgi:5-methylcytosine-specific restriction endonuclease McrA